MVTIVCVAGRGIAPALEMPPALARHISGGLLPGEDMHMVAVVVVVQDDGRRA